jgi:FKBP-type peptidyl-prolyl cis-trans isomerase 2
MFAYFGSQMVLIMGNNDKDSNSNQATQACSRLFSFEFTLSIKDGDEIENNIGKEPMVFRSGKGDIMPSLEAEISTMQVNETKSIVLAPENAYGPSSEEHFREYPLADLPESARKVGEFIGINSSDGKEMIVEVARIDGDKAYLDFNHPMAGKTLVYDIKILSIEPLAE